VIVNRCIGKIIARDLSLVASRLYRMAVTRPQSRVAVAQGKKFIVEEDDILYDAEVILNNNV
jgi:hypothetical protein